MPDDILDAAQKVVDDAVKTADTGVSPQTPPVPSATTVLPPEPAPEPVVSSEPPLSTPPSPTLNEPEPQPQGSPEPPLEEATKLVESLLEPKQPEPSVVAPPPKSPTPPPVKKSSGKGVVLALLAFLLIALPVGVYFISQQNQQLADIRSRAGNTYGSNCTVDPNSCTGGKVCHCQNGTPCTITACEDPNQTQNPCGNQGRSWCKSGFGTGYTCCVPQYVCGPGNVGCVPRGGDDTGGDDDTSITPKCQLIKIYKGNTQVTDLKTLKAGDNVTFAVKGNRVGQKGRFRVNGKALDGTGNWTETTTKNARNEWTVNYTIATGVTDFVIEGEVYIRGAWH